MNSEVPEEEVQVFAGQKGVRLDEFSLFHQNRLEMKFFTREVPSHGLYDYENEANAPLTSTHIVSKATKIYKKDNNLVLVEPHECLDADHQELFTILKQRNRFFVEGVEGDPKVDVDKFYDEGGKPTQPPQSMQERLYDSIRYLQIGDGAQKERLLKKNDVIKLGRIKFKVKQIHIKAQARKRAHR